MKAILYAAKSTEDVHGSIQTQFADCRRTAEREGWEIVGTYRDEASSAYKSNRGPGLAAALEHVERIGGTLMVQHSDRLARGDAIQAAHLVEYALQALKGDFKIYSIQDPQTFADLLYAVVTGQRNHEDSARKSNATKAGKRRAWERGDFPGGRTPDGFQKVDGKVRLDPDRTDAIRLMGDLADQGWGDSPISRELNRRGLKTKGGRPWRRTHVRDILSNPLYYGGIPWHRGAEDEDVNWEANFPTYWTREDFVRRGRNCGRKFERTSRGRPNSNHALAGLATCGRCLDAKRVSTMRPITSSHRRKDGSRKRTYVCGHVQDRTGVCDAPAVDAELVDTHVINELHRYLGNFEAWRDQLLSGYSSERERLEREVSDAVRDFEAQQRRVRNCEAAISEAETATERKVAMSAAGAAQEALERSQRRLEATQDARDAVPEDVPADVLLDFFNNLSGAIRGRLDGADTLGQVNDALRDDFARFVIRADEDGVMVVPFLRPEMVTGFSEWVSWALDFAATVETTPPLRTFHLSETAASERYVARTRVT